MNIPTPRAALRELIVPRLYPLFVRNGSDTFEFQGKTYRYFRHPHNRTWVNERIIEVPLGLDMLEQYKGKRILEVGNVLSNYTKRNHEVLDKYEVSPGVINEDIVTFNPGKKYDLILCISTLEHVGWDETPREPDKVIDAVRNMKKLLAPKGVLLITTPFGYNPYLDVLLLEEKLPVDKTYFLERNNFWNDWHEIKMSELSKTHYSWFIMHANTVAVSFCTSS